MKDKLYLSEEQQFATTLSNVEISRIKDQKLREIRSKFWNERHEAFLDELNISDSKLDVVLDAIEEKERIAIYEYKLELKVE